MSTAKEYTRLPGRGVRREGNFLITTAVRQSQLWLAADHVLLVDSTVTSQDLKRFYFRHIQALQLRKTWRGFWFNITFSLFTALFALFSSQVNDPVGFGILVTFAGVFGLLLLVNSIIGPTSECFIQTAVQREMLPSLGRLRTARKVFARLKPLIEQAQGALTNEEAQTLLREQLPESDALATALATGRRPMPAFRPGMTPPPLVRSNYRGAAHAWLFGLLTADGALNLLLIFQHNFALIVIQMFLILALVVMGIVALIRQQGSSLPPALTRAAWTALGYFVVCFLLGIAQYVVIVVQNPSVADDQVAMMRHFASIDPLLAPWLMITYAISGAFSIGLGLAGVLALRRFHGEGSVPPSSPVAQPPGPPPLAAPLPPPAPPDLTAGPASPPAPPSPPPAPPPHG
ncbi:MAG: hypothetical protein ABMA26_07285 [Limisphaerales bacterium]